MWILLVLLISFGFAVFVGKLLGWCGRNDDYKAEGMPEGKIVNAVWYTK